MYTYLIFVRKNRIAKLAWLQTQRLGYAFWQGKRVFPYSAAFKPPLRPTQAPIQCVSANFPYGVTAIEM